MDYLLWAVIALYPLALLAAFLFGVRFGKRNRPRPAFVPDAPKSPVQKGKAASPAEHNADDFAAGMRAILNS